MHKLLALVTVAILASSVIAADGGINEDTNLTETDFESMEYSNVVYEEQEFTISLTLKNESTNISQINWITQVCRRVARGSQHSCPIFGGNPECGGFPVRRDSSG